MGEIASNRRWYHPTPGHFLAGLLAVEGILLAVHWGGGFHKGYGVLIALASVGVFLVLMLVWFAVALIFRCRFQFSLRSLLVLTLAVALPCSWLATEMKKAREQKEVVEWVEELGGQVSYDYERDSSGNDIPNAQPPGPAWLREWLGVDAFVNVVGVFLQNLAVTDAGLEHLKELTQLQELFLGDTQVTDAGLEHLKGLSHSNRWPFTARKSRIRDWSISRD